MEGEEKRVWIENQIIGRRKKQKAGRQKGRL